MLSNLLKNGEKIYWKMQFLYKIFWQNKILCRPTIPSFFSAETWNGTEVDLYADDSTMHAANKDVKLVEIKLQCGATGFFCWCRSNKMHVCILKTAYMTLASRQNLRREDHIEIYIDKEIIQTVEQLLWVVIDRSLSWDKQIDAECLNITPRITLLKHLSKYIDKSSRNQYYNSYILPVLDYGYLIWGRCSKSNILRLVKLQKRAARIIIKADIYTPSQLLFKEFNWVTFPKRVTHTCTIVYKALNGLAPEYISENFVKIFLILITEFCDLSTKSSSEFQVLELKSTKIYLLFLQPSSGMRSLYIFVI